MRTPARRRRRTAIGCSGSVASSHRNSGTTECTTGAAGRAELGTSTTASGPTTLRPSSSGRSGSAGAFGSGGAGVSVAGSKYSRNRVDARKRYLIMRCLVSPMRWSALWNRTGPTVGSSIWKSSADNRARSSNSWIGRREGHPPLLTVLRAGQREVVDGVGPAGLQRERVGAGAVHVDGTVQDDLDRTLGPGRRPEHGRARRLERPRDRVHQRDVVVGGERPQPAIGDGLGDVRVVADDRRQAAPQAEPAEVSAVERRTRDGTAAGPPVAGRSGARGRRAGPAAQPRRRARAGTAAAPATRRA